MPVITKEKNKAYFLQSFKNLFHLLRKNGKYLKGNIFFLPKAKNLPRLDKKNSCLITSMDQFRSIENSIII